MVQLQNSTETKKDNGENSITNVGLSGFEIPEGLSVLQDLWLTFDAAGGIVEDPETGAPMRMSITDFATKIGVHRTTLYEWRKLIPNYQDLVRRRRSEIFTEVRVSKVWAGVHLKAMLGEHKQAEMVLTHYSDYTPPAQRVKHDIDDGFADLLQRARKRREAETSNDSEIIDGTPNSNV